MIAPLMAILFVTAPCGYIVGDVFAHKNRSASKDWLKYASAVFLPLAAVLALTLITQTEAVEGEDE